MELAGSNADLSPCVVVHRKPESHQPFDVIVGDKVPMLDLMRLTRCFPEIGAAQRWLVMLRRAGCVSLPNLLRARIGNWEQAVASCIVRLAEMQTNASKRPARTREPTPRWIAVREAVERPAGNHKLDVIFDTTTVIKIVFWADTPDARRVLGNVVTETLYKEDPTLWVWHWFLFGRGGPQCFFSLWVSPAAAENKPQRDLLGPINLTQLGFNINTELTHQALRFYTFQRFGLNQCERASGKDYWDRIAEVVEDGVMPVATYALLYAERFGLIVARDASIPEAVPDASGALPLLGPGERNWPRQTATMMALVRTALRSLRSRGSHNRYVTQHMIEQLQSVETKTAAVEAALAVRHRAMDAMPVDDEDLCLAMTLAVERCDPHHVFTYVDSATSAGLYHGTTAVEVTARLRALAMERVNIRMLA